MISHFQRKYLQLRIGEESLAMIVADIQEFDGIEKLTPLEADALWWLKRLLIRGEIVFATYKERPKEGETDGQE